MVVSVVDVFFCTIWKLNRAFRESVAFSVDGLFCLGLVFFGGFCSAYAEPCRTEFDGVLHDAEPFWGDYLHRVLPKTRPYLEMASVSRDETGAIWKPSLSAFKRCQDRKDGHRHQNLRTNFVKLFCLTCMAKIPTWALYTFYRFVSCIIHCIFCIYRIKK